VDNMAALMSAADLFVGAGGTSAWERCCMALPALVLATADNQITQSEALARAGAHLYLGPVHSVTKEQLARLIEETLRLPDLLLHMAEQGRNIVDGRGSIRVANRIKSFAPIRLRRAESGDSRSLFDWRNHPSTRRYALDPTEIEWDVHERWVAAVLADPDRELLIAEQEGRPVGVLRYDISVDRARISIYLVPGMAGHGLGPRILLAGEEWLQDHWLTVRVLEAEIRPENLASLGAFLSAGFTHEHSVLRKSIHGIH
jgi:UDP-2,4-diacetamido-2,4,6-trideoxy-beta-L-altropyranose hydrolase